MLLLPCTVSGAVLSLLTNATRDNPSPHLHTALCSPLSTHLPHPGGELYYDQDKAFYAVVHGGKPARASLLQLLSPTVWRAGKRAKESGLVKDSNYKGDGLTLGGKQAARQLVWQLGGGVAHGGPCLAAVVPCRPFAGVDCAPEQRWPPYAALPCPTTVLAQAC